MHPHRFLIDTTFKVAGLVTARMASAAIESSDALIKLTLSFSVISTQ